MRLLCLKRERKVEKPNSDKRRFEGAPPKSGPNPQVPPVKMNTGGLGECPHRPDGIRGAGAAIKGMAFQGVK